MKFRRLAAILMTACMITMFTGCAEIEDGQTKMDPPSFKDAAEEVLEDVISDMISSWIRSFINGLNIKDYDEETNGHAPKNDTTGIKPELSIETL